MGLTTDELDLITALVEAEELLDDAADEDSLDGAVAAGLGN